MLRKPRALILDLDQTLVDSRCAKALRSERRWAGVRTLIPRFVLAPGVLELNALSDIQLAVVDLLDRSGKVEWTRQWCLRG